MKSIITAFFSSLAISQAAILTIEFDGFLSTQSNAATPSAITGSFSYDPIVLTGASAAAGGEFLSANDFSIFTITAFGQTFGVTDESAYTNMTSDFFGVFFVDGEVDSLNYVVAESMTAFDNLDAAIFAENGVGLGFPFGGNATSITNPGVEAFSVTGTTFTAVPEPASASLLFIGSALFIFRRNRQ